MKQSPFREAESRLVGQEIPRLSWNLKLYCRVDKGPSLDPIVSQMNSVHTLFLEDPRSLSLRLPAKILYAFLMWSMSTTCHAHLILLGFITLIISAEP